MFHWKVQISLLALEQFAKLRSLKIMHLFYACSLFIQSYIYILQLYRYARLEEKRTCYFQNTWIITHFAPGNTMVSSQPFLHQGREAHVLDMLRHYGGVPDSCFAANLGRAPRGTKRRTDMPQGNWVHWTSYITGWWFQTWMLFSIIYGMSSFPLTFIFFKMVETTNHIILVNGLINHQP